MPTAGITSLGCPRNLVDSEVIIGSLKKAGFGIVSCEKNPDVCVINTCAFVEPAREEAIEAILAAEKMKKEGRIRYLVVCGCLPQMYKNKFARKFPAADFVVGACDFPKIAALLKDLTSHPPKKSGRLQVSGDLIYIYDENSPRSLLTPRHYAYVKIAEGCSNFCSYCIIPRLRGLFRSRSIGSILKEVRALSAAGDLKEIDIIGQDTTSFGIDRYGKAALAVLLRRLCESKSSIRWIRLLYTHPAHYTDELIRTVRDEKKICKYLDLPIQHISDHVLKGMNRKTGRRDIEELMEKLREDIPGLILRTSIIVGFPGETEKDFGRLLQFLKSAKFERLGAFIYSPEDHTRAAKFPGQIPQKVKQERFDEIMKLQQGISSDILKSFIGRAVDVLIDEKSPGEDDRFLGRTQGDAPDVDGIVYVRGKNLKAGEFYKVRITDTMEYDMIGERIR